MASVTPGRDSFPDLDHLYRRWWPVVQQSAFEVLEDEDAAADAAQEVFRRLLAQERWKQIDAPGRYFRMAGRNEALRRLRSRQHVVGDAEIDQWLSPLPGPDDPVEGAEFQRNLSKVLTRLPERCAEIVSLVVLRRWTQAEIAAHFGISVKAVEKQMARARRHLPSLVERDEEGQFRWVSSFEDGGGVRLFACRYSWVRRRRACCQLQRGGYP